MSQTPAAEAPDRDGHHAVPTRPPAAGETGDARDRWAAVVLLGLTTFVVVAAEMTPVGLLTPISTGLGASEGTVGLSLAITGLVAAAMAPLTPMLVRGTDRRTAMVVLMLVVAIANALTALSTSFAVMSAARVLLAVGMGGVWAMAPSLAPRLVAPRSVGVAMTIVFGGVAVASAVGVPAGAYIGALAGWRASFWVLSAVSLLLVVALALVLPPMSADRAASRASLTAALGRPAVRYGLGVTALIVTAHFTAYTYMRPTLESLADLDPTVVGTMLLVFGVLGILSNFVIGPRVGRRPTAVAVALATGLALTFGGAPSFVSTVLSAGVLMVLWGFFYGGVSVTTQTAMSRAAPDQAESVNALWAGVFNASIAVGAFSGGRIYDAGGADVTLWTAAALAAGAGALALLGAARTRTR